MKTMIVKKALVGLVILIVMGPVLVVTVVARLIHHQVILSLKIVNMYTYNYTNNTPNCAVTPLGLLEGFTNQLAIMFNCILIRNISCRLLSTNLLIIGSLHCSF